MRRKMTVSVITTIIVSFLAAGIIVAEGKNNGTTSHTTVEVARTFVAYYFHGNFRCSNCIKIEQYSCDAIEKYFKDQLKTKRLVLNIINTDLPVNKHFIEDYQLYTKSLIIAEFKDGKQVRWKNLTKVWTYLNDRDKFYEYVKTEIQQYLEHN